MKTHPQKTDRQEQPAKHPEEQEKVKKDIAQSEKDEVKEAEEKLQKTVKKMP
ncbi:MAG TPA: hypothetical protein VHA56_18060 [Mucilaginibacter sp.]|nr:hypothetical protein [Mucilaginibacter sp.]